METKSFLIDEVKDTVFSVEETKEWQDLVNSLGLTKQADLNEKSESVLPFEVMPDHEQVIYSAVLNSHESLENFGDETIPLKVLQVIALCVREKYFDKIEIWYSKVKADPVVVGIKKDPNSTWRNNFYKIAQWGEKLIPASDLIDDYEKMKRESIESYREYSLRSLKEEVTRFKFEAKALNG